MLLVTGARGFVGKALVDVLQERGIPFRAVSRQEAPGLWPIGSMDGDTDWSDALFGTDAIIHLAARVHVMNETAVDPMAEFRRTNVAATLNLARQAAACGVRRFVFVSSIKVNGEFTEPGRPFTADDTPAPKDPYGVSKWEAEAGLRQIALETGLEVVVIRPVLVYGEGVKGNFERIAGWVRRGYPLPVAGMHNLRSFVSLGNLIDLTLTCVTHSDAAGQVFLAADGVDLSTAQLVAAIAKALGRKPVMFAFPPSLLSAAATVLGKGDMMGRLVGSLRVDISKNKQILGWQPPWTVDEGMERTFRAP